MKYVGILSFAAIAFITETLLAQVSNDPAVISQGAESLWVQLIGSLGPVGALAWYCVYVTSRTIPQMQKQADERVEQILAEREKDREKSDEQLDSVLRAHSEEIEKLRQTVERMVEHCLLVRRGEVSTGE